TAATAPARTACRIPLRIPFVSPGRRPATKSRIVNRKSPIAARLHPRLRNHNHTPAAIITSAAKLRATARPLPPQGTAIDVRVHGFPHFCPIPPTFHRHVQGGQPAARTLPKPAVPAVTRLRRIDPRTGQHAESRATRAPGVAAARRGRRGHRADTPSTRKGL